MLHAARRFNLLACNNNCILRHIACHQQLSVSALFSFGSFQLQQQLVTQNRHSAVTSGWQQVCIPCLYGLLHHRQCTLCPQPGTDIVKAFSHLILKPFQHQELMLLHTAPSSRNQQQGCYGFRKDFLLFPPCLSSSLDSNPNWNPKPKA